MAGGGLFVSSSAASARETLRLVNAVFPLRKCPDTVFRNRTRPCLYHQIGRCLGPCCGLVDASACAELLDEVELFLRGRNQELADRLRAKMRAAADRREYELAAKCRDQLRAVERTLEKQTITSPQAADRDVFGFHKEGEAMRVQALLVRRGRLEDVPGYNLHTHGLHTSPIDISDNIFRSFTDGTTNQVVIEVPKNVAPGTYWYHTHIHGYTEGQVFSGLAGALVVTGHDAGAIAASARALCADDGLPLQGGRDVECALFDTNLSLSREELGAGVAATPGARGAGKSAAAARAAPWISKQMGKSRACTRRRGARWLLRRHAFELRLPPTCHLFPSMLHARRDIRRHPAHGVWRDVERQADGHKGERGKEKKLSFHTTRLPA